MDESDIVQYLRQDSHVIPVSKRYEAASEIERLRAENELLKREVMSADAPVVIGEKEFFVPSAVKDEFNRISTYIREMHMHHDSTITGLVKPLRDIADDCKSTLEAFLQVGGLNESCRMIAEASLKKIHDTGLKF